MQPSAPFTTDWMTSVTAPEHTSAYQEPRPVSIVQSGERTMFLWVWLSVQVLTHLGGVVAEDGVKWEDLWWRRGGASVGLTESQLLLPAIHSEEGRRLRGGGTDSDHHADLKTRNESTKGLIKRRAGAVATERPESRQRSASCRRKLLQHHHRRRLNTDNELTSADLFPDTNTEPIRTLPF